MSTRWKTRPEQIGKMVRAMRSPAAGTKRRSAADRAHVTRFTARRHAWLSNLPHRRRSAPTAWESPMTNRESRLILHMTGDSQSDELPAIRHPHRAHQRRRGDQLAGLAQHNFQLGAEHDATFSVESSRAGVGQSCRSRPAASLPVTLTVKGRASHPATAPEQGVSTRLYELAHQACSNPRFLDPAVGLKMN
mgnify:CR=1 FL=1